MINVDAVRHLASALLAEELPNRWRHSQAVGQRAAMFGEVYDTETSALLMAAGLAHDIGYASALYRTGFHPIDGALHLRRLGADERLVGLVAHHSCACIEARLRGLHRTLAMDFPYDPSLPHDALLFCDLTTGPTGEEVSLDSRLIDVRRRYDPDTIVHRFINLAEPELRRAVARAETLLAGAGRRKLVAA